MQGQPMGQPMGQPIQPTGQPMMQNTTGTVGVVNRGGPVNGALDNQGQPLAAGHNVFSSGIFSCFDDFGLCCTALVCPCLSYQDIIYHAQPRLGDTCSKMCQWSCAALCCGLCCVVEAWTRSEFRTAYKIASDPVLVRYASANPEAEDFLCIWCCNCCALSQMMRHIKKYPLNPRMRH